MNLAQGTSCVLTGQNLSQHQEFELNQTTSLTPLRVHSVGHQLIVTKGPTGQNIFDKVSNPAIISSHLLDQTSISGPLQPKLAQPHQFVCARDHLVKGTSTHPYILPSHDQHREMARRGYIDIEDELGRHHQLRAHLC